jgi:hypothetical protein
MVRTVGAARRSAWANARAIIALGLFLGSVAACGDGGGGAPAVEDAGSDEDSAAEVPAEDAAAPVDAAPPCPSGTRDCRCAPGAQCDDGLRCESGTCKACPAGTDGCPCVDGVCNDVLACLNDVCAPPDCAAGTVGCPCDGTLCNTGLGCGTDSVCHVCRGDLPDCPCVGDACSLGLLCDVGVCRLPLTCDDLRNGSTCFPHQACVEADGEDASCVADTCEAGYLFDAGTGTCVVCPDCVVGTSCVASAAGIGDECAAAYRTCEERSGLAVCGGCASGAELKDGRCLPTSRCGDSVCGAGEYCDRLVKQCVALPCSAGSAKSPGVNGACSPCATACTGTGLTGRYWPFRTRTEKCVCETFDGYFLEASALKAERCDADADGWVRRDADDSAIRDDAALLQNARCEVRRVDRVILRDEYGISLELDSCRSEGFVKTGGACTERFPLRLLESARNDVSGAISSAQTPRYSHGGTGRNLTGAELNGLTKACVSDLGDFDDDGVEDLQQVQTRAISAGTTDADRLLAFSYFIELYRARYVAPTTRPYGDLVIEERSRCSESDFPLHYGSADSYGTQLANGAEPGYWRSCSRFRNPSYVATDNAPGYDFAQWTCSDSTLSCSLQLPGPANPELNYSSVDPNVTLLRNTGLCALDGKLPQDRTFRGFGHHSQFRCMKVNDTPADVNEAPRGAFGPTGSYTFNACEARSCSAGDASCLERRAASDGTFADPYIDCTAVTPAANSVGFALVNYQPYGTGSGYTGSPTSYQGGCVNEDTEWGAKLCPSPEFATYRRLGSFGRYSCYGSLTRWLWASAPNTSVRASLRWAAAPASSAGPTTPAWCSDP